MNVFAPNPTTKPGKAVAGMFSAIAPTYDLLNHLLSFNLDKRWRKRAVGALGARPGERCLDLCTGTGDVALAIAKASPHCGIVGADFSREMMVQAARKAGRRKATIPLAQADALALPFRDGAFDAVTVAFGIRNFEELDRGLGEISRVLKDGGRAVILEFSPPRRSFFGALYRLYFTRILPLAGKLISRDAHAYGYLPATVQNFVTPVELAGKLKAAGFASATHAPLTFGIAVLTVAHKPGHESAINKAAGMERR